MTSETSGSTPTFLASILLFHRPIYHSDPWGNKKHSKEKMYYKARHEMLLGWEG